MYRPLDPAPLNAARGVVFGILGGLILWVVIGWLVWIVFA